MVYVLTTAPFPEVTTAVMSFDVFGMAMLCDSVPELTATPLTFMVAVASEGISITRIELCDAGTLVAKCRLLPPTCTNGVFGLTPMVPSHALVEPVLFTVMV